MLVVTLGVVIAKGVGFGKELFIANRLGAGVDLDVFLIAYLFPAFVIGVLSGAIQSAFVPEYLGCKVREGDVAACRLAAQGGVLVSLSLLLVTILMLPIAFAVLPAVASGFQPAALAHVGRLLPWLMPLLALNCLASYWSGILNAEGKFALVAFTPVITPLCVVLALLCLPVVDGASRLAIGTLVGGLMELGLIMGALRTRGFRLFSGKFAWDGRWRHVAGQLASMALASGLMGLTMFVDQSFAARLEVGSVSALSYGTKFGGVLSSMMVVVVSTLALPAMSRIAAEGDWRRMHRTLVSVSGLLLATTALVVLFLAFASRPIIELAFQHGAFSAAAAGEAARVQFFHAWHIPFYVLGTVALRTVVALRMSYLVIIGSAINLAVNTATNVIAAPVLGVAGVALATTTMYAASCAFLFTMAVRELRRRSASA
jgi:putative peptidoglycan lipid II flippase